LLLVFVRDDYGMIRAARTECADECFGPLMGGQSEILDLGQ